MQIKNSLQFGIGEMTCASCVGRAQKALEGIAGVTAAQVNLANETAQIAVGMILTPRKWSKPSPPLAIRLPSPPTVCKSKT